MWFTTFLDCATHRRKTPAHSGLIRTLPPACGSYETDLITAACHPIQTYTILVGIVTNDRLEDVRFLPTNSSRSCSIYDRGDRAQHHMLLLVYPSIVEFQERLI